MAAEPRILIFQVTARTLDAHGLVGPSLHDVRHADLERKVQQRLEGLLADPGPRVADIDLVFRRPNPVMSSRIVLVPRDYGDSSVDAALAIRLSVQGALDTFNVRPNAPTIVCDSVDKVPVTRVEIHHTPPAQSLFGRLVPGLKAVLLAAVLAAVLAGAWWSLNMPPISPLTLTLTLTGPEMSPAEGYAPTLGREGGLDTAYSLTSARSSISLFVSCLTGSPAEGGLTAISLILDGKRMAAAGQVNLSFSGGDSNKPAEVSVPPCADCADAYGKIWDAIRNKKSLTVQAPGGEATFSLKGTKRWLPETPCR